MIKVFLVTQNVKLASLVLLKKYINSEDEVVLLSTHRFFSTERQYINSLFTVSYFWSFSDLLCDAIMAWCDKKAFEYIGEGKSIDDYYNEIRRIKNTLVLEQLKKRIDLFEGFICAYDLGVHKEVWINNGFSIIDLDYYNKKQKANENITVATEKKNTEVYVAHYKSKKIVFLGKMSRIAYRLNIPFTKSEEEYEHILKHEYYTRDKCIYLTTLHEMGQFSVPEDDAYEIRCAQDGYLPRNYTSLYTRFASKNTQYYAWDILGKEFFDNQGVTSQIIPFRKKLFLPIPIFPAEVKKILIVTSGAGDWTALKNRSDEDYMVEAFAFLAKMFPNIKFIYRCHHSWIHPKHQGINSINRVREYFELLGLKNISVSSNIPNQELSNFELSIPRKSLKEDLIDTDLVIGEHSVAMIDAGFEKIPFASLNLTGRRNMFEGVSSLGFPHFENIDELAGFIMNVSKDDNLQTDYLKAVSKYNMMTELE